MAQEVTIPLGTKATLNGVEVEFATDAVVAVKGANSVDHAAEMGFGEFLTHKISLGKGDEREVYYVNGRRFERDVPKPEKAEKPKKETTPKGTKAKPKG